MSSSVSSMNAMTSIAKATTSPVYTSNNRILFAFLANDELSTVVNVNVSAAINMAMTVPISDVPDSKVPGFVIIPSIIVLLASYNTVNPFPSLVGWRSNWWRVQVMLINM